MHALEEMIALDMRWKDTGPVPAPAEGKTYALYYGEDDVVAQAQATWQYLKFLDLMLWANEGCFQVHMDLTDPVRQSLAWKYGETQSMAVLLVKSEGKVNANGSVLLKDGRLLDWGPKHSIGIEYVMTQPEGDSPLMTIVGVPMFDTAGSNAGFMNLGVGLAGDPALPALVALGLSITTEQIRLLHRDTDRHHQQYPF